VLINIDYEDYKTDKSPLKLKSKSDKFALYKNKLSILNENSTDFIFLNSSKSHTYKLFTFAVNTSNFIIYGLLQRTLKITDLYAAQMQNENCKLIIKTEVDTNSEMRK
jgi:hypothetical protein